MKLVATLDIGSTWTKGALFSVATERLDAQTPAEVRLLKRATKPSSVAHLGDGFFSVLDQIIEGDALEKIRSQHIALQYSSSAKGGLAVAAIGLVPEVTLEIGKVAAQSAGAKLTQVFAYHLTQQDIQSLEKTPPDILLFAGGTDGGNTQYVIANAEAIARSNINCAIIFAGNRSAADNVIKLLKNKSLTVVDNLLPNFNEPNPEPTRDAIRHIFLQSIVKGKGLTSIMEKTGAEPVPTPFAVLEYARAIHTHVPGWAEFMLLDMGGATTDVYSAHQENPAAGIVFRGLPEPVLKRTVEGDLGMRVSAQSTYRVGLPSESLKTSLASAGFNADDLSAYVDMLIENPSYLPGDTPNHQALDEQLAGICMTQAGMRHAGRSTPVFTPEGCVQLQTGRNLSHINKVIGAGGWLAQARDFSPAAWFAAQRIDPRGRQILLPQQFAYFRDEAALFPLLANLARLYPQAAANAGIAGLSTNT